MANKTEDWLEELVKNTPFLPKKLTKKEEC